MRLVMVGSGYVGLVSGVCFADFGHDVVCVDKDPAKMQALVTALWRATQWIKAHTPEQIYDAIEPYVGSTSRAANLMEITALQKVVDYDATIDSADFARGEKVWFREMTGIKPLAIADVVVPTFIDAARKAYPG